MTAPEPRRWVRGGLRSSWLWGALAALASWGLVLAGPGTGLDLSWRTALYMAAREHLRFGRQIVYTYGPLGFLEYPTLAYGYLARWSFLYTAAIALGAGACLVWALRRSFGSLWVAVPGATLALALPLPAEVVIAAVCCLGLLQSPPSTGHARRAAAAAGAFSGLELLVKLNTGTTVTVICLITVLFLPQARRVALAVFAASLGVTALTLWLLAAQRLGDLWAYAHSSLSVMAGYSQAMGVDGPGSVWEYWAAGALTLAGLAAARQAGGISDRPRRWGLAAVWMLLSFAEFKEGFVRHEDAHAAIFLATLPAVFIGFHWPPGRRRAGASLLAIFVMAFFGASHLNPSDLLHPIRRAKLFFTDAGLLLHSDRLTRQIADARVALATSYALDQRSLGLLRDHRVHVDPSEDSVAWAYGLNWRPVPIFQSFSAYTPLLDRVNAESFVSRDGPDRILRPPSQTSDGRYAGFESPAATRAMLCHFVSLRATKAWEVLGRIPDRCGAERTFLTMTVRYGQSIPIPKPPHPDEMVIARVRGIQVSGLEKLRTLLFRAHDRYVVLNVTPFRFVPGTAADGLLMSAPPRADLPGVYRLATDSRTFSFGIVEAHPQQRLTITFSAQRIGVA